MAQAWSFRIHLYLDDWLLRALSEETCRQHTKTLLSLCQDMGWIIYLTKSELIPQQVFNFVGYWFHLSQGLVRPTKRSGAP